jgi:membrane-associated phospholipid phosphatase
VTPEPGSSSALDAPTLPASGDVGAAVGVASAAAAAAAAVGLAPPVSPATGRRWVVAGLAAVGPDFGLVIAFLAVLAGLVVAYGASFVWSEGPIVVAGGIGLGLITCSFVYRLPRILNGSASAGQEFLTAVKRIGRDWGPLTVIMWAFESMETYTGVIRKNAIDDVLYRLDVRLFGEEPSVWAGRFHHPLLTDWMAFTYALYFILPMFLATCLALRGRRADFREMSTAVVVQMGLGFILFLFFPAGPPRYYEPLLHGGFGGFQPAHIHSFFGLYELQQGAFDTADPLRVRSAFPSLHCSIALLTLFYAWRFGDGIFPRRPRLYFWICLPLVVSLWISTIYLRHHWIPDIVAGLLLGYTSSVVSPWIRLRWPQAESGGGAGAAS